jgi:hypothetical protein
VRNAAELMGVLRDAYPGQKTMIEYERAGKTIKVDATFGAPRR